MRKFLAMAMILAAAVLPLAAFTDSYADMVSDPLYLGFYGAIKNDLPESEVIAAYDGYIASGIAPEERVRAGYQIIRYFMDHGNKELALAHLAGIEEQFAAISADTPAVRRDIAEGDLIASAYYVHGGIGNGLKNSDKVKELYGKYPEEISVALNEVFRYLFTPPIAGGSSKKAMRILREMDPQSLSKPDLFSYYVAYGMALSDQDEFDESDAYLDMAQDIYTTDSAIDSTRRDNRRGRI